MSDPDATDCRTALAHRSAYLDAELAPTVAERIRAHLPGCAACAREYEAEARMIAALRASLRAVEVPTETLARLTALLLTPPERLGDGPP